MLLQKELLLFSLLYYQTLHQILLLKKGFHYCTQSKLGSKIITYGLFFTVSPEGSVLLDPVNLTSSIQEVHSFTCHAQGGPDNMFEWTFNGSTLSNANITSASLQSTLTINNILASNGGEYTCTVSNLAGNASNSSTLYVSPYIVINPVKDLTGINGAVMKVLVCVAEAFPNPAYIWTKLTGPGSPMEAVNNGELGTLVFFPGIEFDDYGMYICTASSNDLMVNSSVSTIHSEFK